MVLEAAKSTEPAKSESAKSAESIDSIRSITSMGGGAGGADTVFPGFQDNYNFPNIGENFGPNVEICNYPGKLTFWYIF